MSVILEKLRGVVERLEQIQLDLEDDLEPDYACKVRNEKAILMGILGSFEDCDVCHGEGVVPSNDTTAVCHECSGSGMEIRHDAL